MWKIFLARLCTLIAILFFHPTLLDSEDTMSSVVTCRHKPDLRLLLADCLFTCSTMLFSPFQNILLEMSHEM